MDYRSVVADLMRTMQLDQTAFASEVGVSQGTVSRWLAGSEPKLEQMRKLDALLARGGRPSANRQAPEFTTVGVYGKIGAGAEIFPFDEQIPIEGLFEIEIPFPVPEGARAFTVEGESMWPRYDSGDVVIVWAEIYDAENLHGSEAVVQTADGHRYLKKVRRGTSKKVFDLESHNADTIRDVKLAWAAKVSAVVRKDDWRASVRKAARKKGY